MSAGRTRPTATAARCSTCRPATTRSCPSLIVLFLHGQGATLERDVVGAPGRAAADRRIGPERRAGGAAARARCRRFERRQFLEARPFRRLYRRGGRAPDAALRRPPRGRALQRSAPVVIVAYSGGYLSAAYALQRGGADHRIKGVILMDALYGDEDKFAGWAAARRRQAFLLSAYTDSTKDENATLRRPAGQAACALHQGPAAGAERRAPFAFVAVRSDRHAWRFYYTRLAARSPETCAGDDSRLCRGSC